MFFKFILGTESDSSFDVQIRKTTGTCVIQWYLVYFTYTWSSQGLYINRFTWEQKESEAWRIHWILFLTMWNFDPLILAAIPTSFVGPKIFVKIFEN